MQDNREKQYTSMPNKLLNHLARLGNAKKERFFPINIQLAPTNKCNLNCEFCSVKDRADNELTLQQVQEIVTNFNHLGAKSIEITGGGDPTMYPYINETINYCDKLGYKIGLITNGIALKNISVKNLNKLMWLRISLSMLDFNENFEWEIPKIKGTLGFSYVWHAKSKPELLDKIYALSLKHHTEYVRIVPDCLEAKSQIKYRNEVAALIKQKKYEDKIFVQTKPYDVVKPCYIGAFKPFINADGYIYHCSAVPLYNRKFEKEWRICHIDDVKKIFPDNFKPCSAEMCRKGKCFYSEQNKLLNDLQIKVKHNGFI